MFPPAIKQPSWKAGFTHPQLPDSMNRFITNGAAVSAPSENLGFLFGGMRGQGWGEITANDASANITADTLITVNMTAIGQEVWRNDTLPDYIPGRASGGLVWLPVSTHGLLVAFGGVMNLADLYPQGLSTEQVEENVSGRKRQ